MALSGTLKDFNTGALFQLIGQEQKTGVLKLSRDKEEVLVHFQAGALVRAESNAREDKDKLGRMLLRAGLINPLQLDAALEEQRRTLRRLGDILVGQGVVQRDDLKAMAQLQTSETVYPLFDWKDGTYAFEQGEVDFDPEVHAAVRSETVLMEGFRRVDEWPRIKKVIKDPLMTFELLKPLPPPKPAKKKKPGADSLDLGDEEPDDGSGLSRTERAVMGLWSPQRTVQDIVDLSRLGDFEGQKALGQLCDKGYLKAVAAAGVGAVVAAKQPLLLFGARELLGLGVSTAVLVLGGLLFLGPARGGNVAPSDPAAQRALTDHQLARIRQALQVYLLEHGQVPEALAALVDEGLLGPTDLQFPWAEHYYYQRTADRAYALLPPLR
jgi:hypothetical protein